MICKNCGAEYPDSDLQCPYCHTENRKATFQRKKEILQGYDKEEQKIRVEATHFPQKTVNQWTKYIVRGLGIAAIAGIFAGMIALIVTKVSTQKEYEEKQVHEAELEKLFKVGNYAGMDKYMDEIGSFGYDKYAQVCDMYHYYLDIKDGYEDITKMDRSFYKNKQDWEDLNEYTFESVFDGGIRLAENYERYVQDKIFLSNEDVLEELYEAGMKELERYGFTKEDMTDLAENEDSNKRNEMYRKMVDYLWEKVK